MTETPQGKLHLLYLDDLAVGQTFVSAEASITEADILAFARAYDPQPFHLDPEAAKATLFGGLAASGWHTAGLTMRLNVEGGLPFAGGIVGLGGEVKWPRPTRAGDVLHVESRILEITPSRSKPDRGTVSVVCETRNQRGEVVQELKAKLMVLRRT